MRTAVLAFAPAFIAAFHASPALSEESPAHSMTTIVALPLSTTREASPIPYEPMALNPDDTARAVSYLQFVATRAGDKADPKEKSRRASTRNPVKSSSTTTTGLSKTNDAWFWASIALAGASVVTGSASIGMYFREKDLGDSAFVEYRAAVASGSGAVDRLRDEVIRHDDQMNAWQIAGWTMVGVGLASGASAMAAWFTDRTHKGNNRGARLAFYPVLRPECAALASVVTF